MNQARQIRHLATEDFPLSLGYFTPLGLNPAGAVLKDDAHRDFEFYSVRSGLVEFQLDGRHYHACNGDYIFISPWQRHSIRTLQMDTSYIWLRFPPELLCGSDTHFFHTRILQPLARNQLYLPEMIQADHPVHGQLETLISILDRDREYSDAYKLQLMGMLFGIFAALLPYCDGPAAAAAQKKKPTTVTRQVMKYIKEHYQQRLTMDQIAKHVHLHPNYLSVLFKQTAGRTVMTYLNQVRLNQACTLLRYSNLPIHQIAEACGFQSPSFFTRRFQQALHISPSTYRKRQPPER